MSERFKALHAAILGRTQGDTILFKFHAEPDPMPWSALLCAETQRGILEWLGFAGAGDTQEAALEELALELQIVVEGGQG